MRQIEPTKRLGAWLFIAFGALLALAAWSKGSAPAELMADLVLWPVDGGQSITQESRLLSGILGGVMMGLGVLILSLIKHLYQSNPTEVRKVVLAGVWTWFVVDSTASMVAGAPLNAVFNIGFLASFVIPWREERVQNPAS